MDEVLASGEGVKASMDVIHPICDGFNPIRRRIHAPRDCVNPIVDRIYAIRDGISLIHGFTAASLDGISLIHGFIHTRPRRLQPFARQLIGLNGRLISRATRMLR
jgi:hypothetical protein